MRRNERVVNPLLDLEAQERHYRMHYENLAGLRPTINTSRPDEVPRLARHKKNKRAQCQFADTVSNEIYGLITARETEKNKKYKSPSKTPKTSRRYVPPDISQFYNSSPTTKPSNVNNSPKSDKNLFYPSPDIDSTASMESDHPKINIRKANKVTDNFDSDQKALERIVNKKIQEVKRNARQKDEKEKSHYNLVANDLPSLYLNTQPTSIYAKSQTPPSEKRSTMNPTTPPNARKIKFVSSSTDDSDAAEYLSQDNINEIADILNSPVENEEDDEANAKISKEVLSKLKEEIKQMEKPIPANPEKSEPIHIDTPPSKHRISPERKNISPVSASENKLDSEKQESPATPTKSHRIKKHRRVRKQKQSSEQAPNYSIADDQYSQVKSDKENLISPEISNLSNHETENKPQEANNYKDNNDSTQNMLEFKEIPKSEDPWAPNPINKPLDPQPERKESYVPPNTPSDSARQELEILDNFNKTAPVRKMPELNQNSDLIEFGSDEAIESDTDAQKILNIFDNDKKSPSTTAVLQDKSNIEEEEDLSDEIDPNQDELNNCIREPLNKDKPLNVSDILDKIVDKTQEKEGINPVTQNNSPEFTTESSKNDTTDDKPDKENPMTNDVDQEDSESNPEKLNDTNATDSKLYDNNGIPTLSELLQTPPIKQNVSVEQNSNYMPYNHEDLPQNSTISDILMHPDELPKESDSHSQINEESIPKDQNQSDKPVKLDSNDDIPKPNLSNILLHHNNDNKSDEHTEEIQENKVSPISNKDKSLSSSNIIKNPPKHEEKKDLPSEDDKKHNILLGSQVKEQEKHEQPNLSTEIVASFEKEPNPLRNSLISQGTIFENKSPSKSEGDKQHIDVQATQSKESPRNEKEKPPLVLLLQPLVDNNTKHEKTKDLPINEKESNQNSKTDDLNGKHLPNNEKKEEKHLFSSLFEPLVNKQEENKDKDHIDEKQVNNKNKDRLSHNEEEDKHDERTSILDQTQSPVNKQKENKDKDHIDEKQKNDKDLYEEKDKHDEKQSILDQIQSPANKQQENKDKDHNEKPSFSDLIQHPDEKPSNMDKQENKDKDIGNHNEKEIITQSPANKQQENKDVRNHDEKPSFSNIIQHPDEKQEINKNKDLLTHNEEEYKNDEKQSNMDKQENRDKDVGNHEEEDKHDEKPSFSNLFQPLVNNQEENKDKDLVNYEEEENYDEKRSLNKLEVSKEKDDENEKYSPSNQKTEESSPRMDQKTDDKINDEKPVLSTIIQPLVDKDNNNPDENKESPKEEEKSYISDEKDKNITKDSTNEDSSNLEKPLLTNLLQSIVDHSSNTETKESPRHISKSENKNEIEEKLERPNEKDSNNDPIKDSPRDKKPLLTDLFNPLIKNKESQRDKKENSDKESPRNEEKQEKENPPLASLLKPLVDEKSNKNDSQYDEKDIINKEEINIPESDEPQKDEKDIINKEEKPKDKSINIPESDEPQKDEKDVKNDEQKEKLNSRDFEEKPNNDELAKDKEIEEKKSDIDPLSDNETEVPSSIINIQSNTISMISENPNNTNETINPVDEKELSSSSGIPSSELSILNAIKDKHEPDTKLQNEVNQNEEESVTSISIDSIHSDDENEKDKETQNDNSNDSVKIDSENDDFEEPNNENIDKENSENKEEKQIEEENRDFPNEIEENLSDKIIPMNNSEEEEKVEQKELLNENQEEEEKLNDSSVIDELQKEIELNKDDQKHNEEESKVESSFDDLIEEPKEENLQEESNVVHEETPNEDDKKLTHTAYEEKQKEEPSQLNETPEEESRHISDTPKEEPSHLSETPKEELSHLSETPKEELSNLSETPKEEELHLSETPKEESSHLRETPKEESANMNETPKELQNKEESKPEEEKVDQLQNHDDNEKPKEEHSQISIEEENPENVHEKAVKFQPNHNDQQEEIPPVEIIKNYKEEEDVNSDLSFQSNIARKYESSAGFIEPSELYSSGENITLNESNEETPKAPAENPETSVSQEAMEVSTGRIQYESQDEKRKPKEEPSEVSANSIYSESEILPKMESEKEKETPKSLSYATPVHMDIQPEPLKPKFVEKYEDQTTPRRKKKKKATSKPKDDGFQMSNSSPLFFSTAEIPETDQSPRITEQLPKQSPRGYTSPRVPLFIQSNISVTTHGHKKKQIKKVRRPVEMSKDDEVIFYTRVTDTTLIRNEEQLRSQFMDAPIKVDDSIQSISPVNIYKGKGEIAATINSPKTKLPRKPLELEKLW